MDFSALIAAARDGDEASRDELCRRCIPPLRGWAMGRLPRQSRPLISTLDVVHETVVAALARLDSFEDRHEGALMAYLRTAILNRIRDEIRRARARPEAAELPGDLPARGASPLEDAVGLDAHRRYLEALGTLNPRYAQAVVLHVELGYDLDALARAIEAPTAHAARMTLRRALAQLAEEMGREA